MSDRTIGMRITRVWGLTSVLVLVAGGAAPSLADDIVWPTVRAKGVLLVDLDRQRVLYESNATDKMPPASLTKIMTGMIAFEEGHLQATVTVSRHAASATGHRLRLRAGQSFRLLDLIDAMLVTSANDACRAVADAIAGSEAAFVKKMNQYARTLGLKDTHFANACGFDARGHYSSASDLARLATTALSQPAFRDSVRMHRGVLRTLDGQRTYRYRTTNRLMADFAGMVGVKTGFTNKAGRCLIARATREEGDLLLVMLNAPSRWRSATAMLTRGFEVVAGEADPARSGQNAVTRGERDARNPVPL